MPKELLIFFENPLEGKVSVILKDKEKIIQKKEQTLKKSGTPRTHIYYGIIKFKVSESIKEFELEISSDNFSFAENINLEEGHFIYFYPEQNRIKQEKHQRMYK